MPKTELEKLLDEYNPTLKDRIEDLIPVWMWQCKHFVTDKIDAIKYALQRAFRGYDDTALWNLERYIADISIPIIENQIKNGYGHPMGLTSEEWDNIRKQIVKGLKAMKELDEGDFWIDEDKEKSLQRMEYLTKKQNDGLELFGKWLPHLWD